MKKQLLLFIPLLLVCVSQHLFAQVGIGTASSPVTPDPKAMLDIVSANTGLLMPRVNLGVEGIAGGNLVSSNPEALVVYNTNASYGSGKGYYFWNGTAWERVVTQSIANPGTVTNVATGAGLTGGPITSTGTISIANSGVTNAMLQNNSITVNTGTGLSGGGTVALGGTLNLTNTGVTSVGLSLPSIFSVSGSPVTSTGTLTGSLANQNANVVFAGPASGGAGTPSFRSLVAADLPAGSNHYIQNQNAGAQSANFWVSGTGKVEQGLHIGPGVGTDNNYGLYFNTTDYGYAIYRESGGWTHPYPDLRIAFHTGIKLGAHYNYNGTRFYDDSDFANMVMAVNDVSTSGRGNVYMTGNVGIGGVTPAVKLAVGGTGSNVYNTDVWVENNLHVQGNETLTQGGRGRMRVGTAWQYIGLYAEASSTGVVNDLVLGSSSGLVRVGPNAGGQNLKVSGLEGTGNRGVYAASNGTLAVVPLNSALDAAPLANGVNWNSFFTSGSGGTAEGNYPCSVIQTVTIPAGDQTTAGAKIAIISFRQADAVESSAALKVFNVSSEIVGIVGQAGRGGDGQSYYGGGTVFVPINTSGQFRVSGCRNGGTSATWYYMVVGYL